MAKNIKDTDLGLKKFIEQLQVAKTTEVVIGIHEVDKNDEGLTVAEYAAYNEFGTEDIPERSFMRSTFDEKVRQIESDMKAEYGKVADGKSTVYRALSIVGLKHETDIKEKIRSGVNPPNAEYTIAKKGSDKTLIDTGAMINHVRYIIRRSS